MDSSLYVLCSTAVAIGVVHTVLGPDHYLPFVMIGRAQSWSRLKLACVTALCGVGHVASSVALGFVGIAFGIAVSKLEIIEGTRGTLASYLLIAFGLAYGSWGLYRARRGKPHTHRHVHLDSGLHVHEHAHTDEHLHAHEREGASEVTLWTVFIIFVLGPCEPLIPLLMFPAAAHSYAGVAIVAGVFGLATITTMTAIALLLHQGIRWVPLRPLERYVHALAGFVIALSGLAIVSLGV